MRTAICDHIALLHAKPSEAGLHGRRRRDGVSELSPPLGGSEGYEVNCDAGQAEKSARGMPWHQEPMKDVTSCDKLRGAANTH